MTRRKVTMPKRKVKTPKAKSAQNPKKTQKPKTGPFQNTGAIIGRSIGGLFGRPNLGGDLGGWLGTGIGKIFGSGSYKLARNSVWSTADQCPAMHSNSENIVVRHREYICDIQSSTTFTNLEFPINPGMSSVFPFLSTIASNFQEYAFKGLVFEFRSTSANALNSTNTALGTVAMAVQYRAGATSFTNKQQVLNEMWAADSKPSENFYMPVECAPAECPMDVQYVRTSAVPSGEDIRFYDLGKLSVSTVGSQAIANVGELWATYEVALKKPILTGAIGANVESAAIVRTAILPASPLGTVQVTAINNSIGAVATYNSLTLPSQLSGKFYVSFFWYGSTTGWTVPSFALSGASYVTINGYPNQLSGPASGSSMAYQAIISIPDTNVPCVFSISNNGVFGSSTYLDITIAQMDFDTVST